MPTKLQLRRGTTTEHASFTGVVGEVTIDTTKDTAVVHDGSTAGGHELARADGSNFTGGVDLSSVSQNIVPSTDITYDLGSPTKQWRDVYVGPGSLYVNGQRVLEDNSGTITVTADENQNLSLQTSGSGDIQIDPTGTGIIAVKGAMQIEDGNSITNSAGNAITFANNISVDQISSRSSNTDLTLSGNGSGNVIISDALTVSGDLTVNGTTTTINSTALSVDDLNITVASGAANAAAANGAGLTVDGAAATLTYASGTDSWVINKALDAGANNITTTGTINGDVTGNLTGNVTGNVIGNVTGTVSSLSNHDTDGLGEGSLNLYFTNARVDAEIDSYLSAGTGISIASGAISVDTSTIATKSYVDTEVSSAVSGIVDSAPGALDTLNELAAALGDDANFASTVTNNLALKAPLASPALSGVPTAPTATVGTNTTQVATTAFVLAEIAALKATLYAHG